MSNHPCRDVFSRAQFGCCCVFDHLIHGSDLGFDTLVCSIGCFSWEACLMMVLAFLSAATCFATSIGPVSLSVWEHHLSSHPE